MVSAQLAATGVAMPTCKQAVVGTGVKLYGSITTSSIVRRSMGHSVNSSCDQRTISGWVKLRPSGGGECDCRQRTQEMAQKAAPESTALKML